jgi:hypothetical protein
MVLAITSSASSNGQVFLPNQRSLTCSLFIWVLFSCPTQPPNRNPYWSPKLLSSPSLILFLCLPFLVPRVLGELQVHQAEPPHLVRLQYLWEVTWYPRGCCLRQTDPLPFIPWGTALTPYDWGLFFKVYSFRSTVFCVTGSPRIGYGCSPCTDGLG